ncbi:hypothetical protein KUW19_00050 [Ferrimonas balearica]|uniref:hypothetical protein n=1 Tax=Ferrimonas balearica TaxID=44012 RepID=UPI001C982E37|nr:hypothetical protein [Ferrimonas balearica]MBY6104872.1 hypothetical protein [Ferrimonas balearica]
MTQQKRNQARRQRRNIRALRSKRHNPTKRLQRHQSAAARRYGIAWVGGIAEPVLIDLKAGRVCPPLSKVEADAITEGRHHWAVHCAVLLRTQTGSDYMQTVMVRPAQPRQHHELVDVCNEEHQALIKSTNPQHFVNAAWLATCAGEELPDETLAGLFAQLDGWEPLARWQADEAERRGEPVQTFGEVAA